MRGMRIICISATEVAAPRVYLAGRRISVSELGLSFEFEILIMACYNTQ